MGSNDSHPRPFPAGRVLAWLSVVAVALVVALWLVLPLLFSDHAGARSAVLTIGLATWLSGLLSVLPVAGVSATRANDVMLYVKAYFLGAGLRILVCLAALVIAVKPMGLPAAPVVITLMVVYLPLLFIETAGVTRYIKSPDGPSRACNNHEKLPRPEAGAEVSA